MRNPSVPDALTTSTGAGQSLERGTRELFGSGLDHDDIRQYVHGALRRTSGDASVRVQIIHEDPSVLMSGANDRRRVRVMVMVTTRPPADPDDTPRRLRSVEYERPLPHIKHLDTSGVGVSRHLLGASPSRVAPSGRARSHVLLPFAVGL